jgi:hypothetical protein
VARKLTCSFCGSRDAPVLLKGKRAGLICNVCLLLAMNGLVDHVHAKDR